MRVLSLCVVTLLVAASLSAGTISSIDPPSFPVTTAEEFVTISGTGLGDVVRFSGPAGTFDVPINATTSSGGVISWVPTMVLYTAGQYKVWVLGGPNGTSGPVAFDILGPRINKLTLVLPEILLVPAKSREGAIVKYDVSAIGGEDPEPEISCEPASGSLMKIGVTNVRCIATNKQGDRDAGDFDVTVYDGGVPIVTVPKSFEVEAEDDKGAVVRFDAKATDDLDGDLIPSCSPASGDLFPVGQTEVVCSAVDAWGNLGIGTFNVDVTFKSLVLHLPDEVIAEAETSSGAHVAFEVTATSPDERAEVEIECDPASGDFFELGTKTVRCVARDSLGNSDEGTFDVTVKDTVGPFVTTLAARPDYLPPTGEMTLVELDLDVIDIVDPSPKCAITDVTANEPIDGEWRIAGDLAVYLNAKYSGKVDRLYSVNVQCTDELENVSTASASVVVADKPPVNLSKPAPEQTRKRRPGQ